jgi:LPXTG-site transpeptidase (sortase) family protein
MNISKSVLITAILAVIFLPTAKLNWVSSNVLGEAHNFNFYSVIASENTIIPEVVENISELVEGVSEVVQKEGDTIFSKKDTQNIAEAPTKDIFLGKYDYELIIPAISVKSPVLGMGVTSDGKMDVPDNYTEIGWYSLGSAPGEIGNAVLGAHVDDGSSIAGVFKNLRKLKLGDSISVVSKTGEVFRYKINDIKRYAHDLEDTREVFGSNGTSRLVLITCDGTFLPKLNTYDERLIIFADLVK